MRQLAHDLRKLRAEAGGPTYRMMAARSAFSATTLAHAASGRVLPSLPVVLAYAEACDADPQDWERRWRQAAQELAQQPPDDGADAPYRGLARFEPSDRALFFGRDQLVGQVVELIAKRRFVALVGASGSGKSSLLRAGIVPTLQEQPEGAPRLAEIRIMTPGGRHTPEHGARLTAAPAEGSGDALLVVDQFEEVFTLCPEPDRFLELLLTACDESSRLRVVVAVRADFYGHCAQHPGLAAALRDASVLVGPMSADELREAVVGPATHAGLIVERTLTARIVDEAVREPGGLPLMSHALMETWRRRRGRALTEEMYEAAGGMQGAVATTAEALHHRLAPAQAVAARRILLRLVTPGDGTEDTRRPTDLSELDAASSETSEVLEQLVRARLLILDGNTVDLAHEALISAWPRYRAWIDEERDRLRLHRRLTDAARTWEEHDRDPGALYRGTRLTAAADAFTGQARDALTGSEKAFLDASTAARDHERRLAVRTVRRLRTLTATLAVLLVLALTAGVVALLQSRSSDQARDTALAAGRVALSRQLAADSTSVAATDSDLSRLLAAQAYTTSPTDEAVATVYAAAWMPLRRRLTTRAGPVTALAFTSDGKTVAWGAENGSVRVTGVADGRSRMVLDSGTGQPESSTAGTGRVESLAFRPGGRALVSTNINAWVRTVDPVTGRKGAPVGAGGYTYPGGSLLSADGATVTAGLIDGSVTVLDTATGRTRRTFRPHYSPPVARSLPFPPTCQTTTGCCPDVPALSPDGRTLVTGSPEGTVTLWDAGTGRPRRTLKDASTWLTCLAFSPDGRTAVWANTTDGMATWSTATGRPLISFAPPPSPVTAMAFSHDGHLLAVGSQDGDVRVQDAATGFTLAVLSDAAGPTTALAFSPDGRTLASGSGDGRLRLWDTTHNLPRLTVPHLPTAPGASVTAFGPHGRSLVTAQDNATVALTDIASGRTRLLPHVTGLLDRVALSPDGRYLAGTHGGTGRMWDTAGGRPLILTTGIGQAVAFSPDGRLLASGDDSAVRLWNTRDRQVRTTLHLPRDSFATAMTFSPDGRTLAVQDGGGNLLLLDVATGRPRRGWTVPRHVAFGTQLSFSPDGHVLAGSGDDKVCLWDTATGRLRSSLAADTTEVTAVAFSRDGRTLAAASQSGVTRLWATATWQVRAELTSGTTAVTSVAFSPDSRMLVTSGQDGTAHLWELDLPTPAEALAEACAAVHRALTPQERTHYLPNASVPGDPCATHRTSTP